MEGRLEQFLKTKNPGPSWMHCDDVADRVARIGIKVQRMFLGRNYLFKDGYVSMKVSVDPSTADFVVLEYKPRISGENVVFEPYISNRIRVLKSHNFVPSIIDRVEKEIAPSVTIKLPEPIVELPVPEWVRASPSSDPYKATFVESRMMFLSEAREVFDSFVNRANTRLGR